ncbi:MAG: MOSC domain-containing protein [Pseudomonadota bacterium]
MLDSTATRLVSVNVGEIRTLTFDDSSHESGIVKRPVNGPARITVDGVAGDKIADPRYHGGPDQAVYAYSLSDYDWWHAETGKVFSAGLFGENLTIAGLPTHLSIGDRLLIGDVVLEATGPRIPCAKLAAVMKDARFPFLFRQAERPGCYFRVLNPGTVTAGDGVDYVAAADSSVSTLDVLHLYHDMASSTEALQRALETPLASRLRDKFSARLEVLAK